MVRITYRLHLITTITVNFDPNDIANPGISRPLRRVMVVDKYDDLAIAQIIMDIFDVPMLPLRKHSVSFQCSVFLKLWFENGLVCVFV